MAGPPPVVDLGAERAARRERDLIGNLAADFVACHDPAEAVDSLRREHPHATEAQLVAPCTERRTSRPP